MTTTHFTWLAIFRLALVQACLGGIVVLTTSTLNRIMVVELQLAALIPGALVAFHYVIQLIRPRVGFASDQGRRLSHWIIGGIAVLACGGFLAAIAVVLMGSQFKLGLGLAVIAFAMIGVGVSCSGTSLLVLLAKHVEDTRRAPAATLLWVTMIFGFALTAGIAGKFLDPFSPQRLLWISGTVSVLAVLFTVILLKDLEPREQVATMRVHPAQPLAPQDQPPKQFWQQLLAVWQEPDSRRFTIFIFLSMLAFNAQDLILEPFAGIYFALTPGQTTQLSGLQHAGVMTGMLLVAVTCGPMGKDLLTRSWPVAGRYLSSLRNWSIGGCLASALAMLGLVGAAGSQGHWPLHVNVFLLGLANGAFSIAAISTMMALSGEGHGQRRGTRMGLWGAAQALAFGSGGFLGAALSDLVRVWTANPAIGYAVVFAAEALLFAAAAALAVGITSHASQQSVNEQAGMIGSPEPEPTMKVQNR